MRTQVESWLRIHEVFHPTDSSPRSDAAFLHALRISAAAGARLTLMRVGPDDPTSSDTFPEVRATLQRWRMQGRKDKSIPELVVRRHSAHGNDPAKSCLKSLEMSPAKIIVVLTHALNGRMTWLATSIAEPLARSSHEMTLLVPEGITGFASPDDGAVVLKRILVPVASRPRPEPAVGSRE